MKITGTGKAERKREAVQLKRKIMSEKKAAKKLKLQEFNKSKKVKTLHSKQIGDSETSAAGVIKNVPQEVSKSISEDIGTNSIRSSDRLRGKIAPLYYTYRKRKSATVTTQLNDDSTHRRNNRDSDDNRPSERIKIIEHFNDSNHAVREPASFLESSETNCLFENAVNESIFSSDDQNLSHMTYHDVRMEKSREYNSNRIEAKVKRLKKSLGLAKNRERKLRKLNEKLLLELKRLKNKFYKAISKKKTYGVYLKNVKHIESKGKTEIRESLLLGEVLRAQLLENKEKLRNECERSMYAQILSGIFITEYHLVNRMKKINSGYFQRKFVNAVGISFTRSTAKKKATRKEIETAVRKFLEKEENAIVCPGIRDIIKRHGIIKRKRYLTDRLVNLHKKYLKEERLKISKGMFFKCKPFWIVQKKISARDTCLCKNHANFQFIFRKLLCHKIVTTKNI